jgi:hypothetical protein
MLTQLSWRYSLIIGIVVIILFAALLYFMGQPLICECGFVKFWHGPTALTSENSQHITDWYTFSHIIHGFAFYFFAWLIGKKWGWPVGSMFLLALLAEVGWELFENTDFIINRYREVTISYDYFGDSIINSVGDALAMGAGFFMAWRLPVWVTVMLLFAMEAFVGYYIRDNLALNIIMLIYPLDFLLQWQAGLPAPGP